MPLRWRLANEFLLVVMCLSLIYTVAPHSLKCMDFKERNQVYSPITRSSSFHGCQAIWHLLCSLHCRIGKNDDQFHMFVVPFISVDAMYLPNAEIFKLVIAWSWLSKVDLISSPGYECTKMKPFVVALRYGYTLVYRKLFVTKNYIIYHTTFLFGLSHSIQEIRLALSS